MKRSWRTTLGGSLLALGIAMLGSELSVDIEKIGAAIATVGALINGWNGRDHRVSSEDAGIK